MSKHTHKTKDGRTAKKGLYYYMNRAKKRGTSKPGKGTVTDEALARSKKTAKKAMMGGKKEMMYKDGGKSEFGMLSVKAGYDDNPNPTAADRIVGAKKGKKKMGGKKMMKYKKGGMKQQAAIAINMKKEGKMPKDKMGMGGKKKMMKDGGKKKMGYGGMMKKKKMMGGGTMKKKMMYETGGFLEPGIPNIDDINCC
jgi:hypothetical protein